MTCRALIDGEELIPLLHIRRGEMTPRQCDHHFKGLFGDCPTCKAQSENADVEDGSSYAQAILALRQRGFRVDYKRFGYGSDGSVEPWRVCYWGHPPGYWKDVPFRNCQNANTDAHAVNLQVIREHYEKHGFPPDLGFVIKTEQRLRRPGDPPRAYSPDLAIYAPTGQRVLAVEYQRSYEPYDKFCERDELRRSEQWMGVDWWFDDTQHNPNRPTKTVYDKSQEHRTHLAALQVTFYRCWVDPDTLKLQGELGKAGNLPPRRKKRKEKRVETAGLRDCSMARLMREVEEPGGSRPSSPESHLILPTRGSDLEFHYDPLHSIENERRLALETLKRQRQLEDQDRNDREFAYRRTMVPFPHQAPPSIGSAWDLEA